MSNPIKYNGQCPAKCPSHQERLILTLRQMKKSGKTTIDSSKIAKQLNFSSTQSASHKLLGVSGVKRVSDRTFEFTGEEIK
jgi:hypothetical protein